MYTGVYDLYNKHRIITLNNLYVITKIMFTLTGVYIILCSHYGKCTVCISLLIVVNFFKNINF